jgi:hypothetical protein
MKDAVGKPDFLGAINEYIDTFGRKDVSLKSVASHYPGISASSLQRRV